MNGLDLFSGIGGLTLALEPWARPVAYCESDRFAQAVLLSRMADGRLPVAPIWDDVRTITADMLPRIDIIYGGFPCQDISLAGAGAGLGGKQSGLFFEIIRLSGDLRPQFVFLENVAAIVNRGMPEILRAFTEIGYDCRWTVNRASDFGAPHHRARWWLLAYANSKSVRFKSRWSSGQDRQDTLLTELHGSSRNVADTMRERCHSRQTVFECQGQSETSNGSRGLFRDWSTSSGIRRVVDGLPRRVDRVRGLGNAVVPRQAQEAFKELIGVR